MALFFTPVANVVLSSVHEEGQASGANNAIRELLAGVLAAIPPERRWLPRSPPLTWLARCRAWAARSCCREAGLTGADHGDLELPSGDAEIAVAVAQRCSRLTTSGNEPAPNTGERSPVLAYFRDATNS
jgi:hypothetical protein